MKISISRHHLYILFTSLILFIAILLFAFLLLIPKGKEYRAQRMELQKSNMKLQKYQEYHNKIYTKLKNLQSKNRHIIVAFESRFNGEKFQKENRKYFTSLSLSQISKLKDEAPFSVYEVNTTSDIDSPKLFYNFLDGLQKSDWIIGINFPIIFERHGKKITSSFTMKVYANKEKSKKRASSSKAK